MASSPRIDELRKKFDENPRRYFAPLANEYRKAGDFAQAIAICREYLPQQPGHMSGHIVFGQALYEARQFDEAKTVFETALSLDPENLIALKHLGDIELIAGKTDAARAWYKKILDADPRNEEILAQLAKLEEKAKGGKVGATMVMQAVPRPGSAPKAPSAPKPAAPAPAAPATPAAAGPKPPSAAAPTPVVTPAVPRPAPPPAAAAPVVTADSPTQEIRLDTIPTHAPPTPPAAVEPALGLEPTSMGGAVEPQSFSSSPTIEIDSPVSASKEAAPANSFSLEGLETTSLAADTPAAAPPPPMPPVAEAPAEGLVDLDISIPAAAPEPPAAPVAAAPAADTVELDFAPPAAAPSAPPPAPAEGIDLDFAPPPAPAAPDPVSAAAPPETPAAEELPLLDLGSSEAPVPPPPAPMAELPPIEEPVASPAIDFIPPEPVETPAPEPEPVAAAPQPDSSSAFVTETMAELYLKQGHHEEALKVYRALLEKRPGDAGLQAKIASLQPPAAPLPRTGPSIRELLHVIALRRPGYRPEPPSNGNGAAAHAAAAAVGPDALAYLFGNAAVSPADDAAALLLSTAFVARNGHDSMVGVPAHQAANDLSLNTVFAGENPAPQPPPSSFSFDKFFSQRATAEHDAQGVAAEPAESKEDVAQFSQWLEGLKQK
jgi:tetratricopeptide (TPR) repeat protein